MSIGKHEKPNKGDSVIWLTPLVVLQSLGQFDLDPCAAPTPRPWSTARRHIELPKNGLSETWEGRVWMNPPYDEGIGKWLEKMAKHGSGIALIFARTEIKAWHKWVFPFADSIFYFEGRLTFHRPDGSLPKGNAGAPSVLIAYSEFDTAILRCSGLRGSLQKRA